MVDIFSTLDGSDGGTAPLSELKLSESATPILIFTNQGEIVPLHYEGDETVRAYLVCAGAGCPICRFGDRPKQFSLLPVYDIQSATIKVLRIPPSRGSGTLASQMAAFVRRASTTDSAALIYRVNSTYTVKELRLTPHADRGVQLVQTFMSSLEQGVKLEDAFLHMSAEEMDEIPRIRRLRDSLDLGPNQPE